MTYAEIKKELEDAPLSWLPALALVAAEQAIKKKVFVKGGLTRLVEDMEEKQAQENK